MDAGIFTVANAPAGTWYVVKKGARYLTLKGEYVALTTRPALALTFDSPEAAGMFVDGVVVTDQGAAALLGTSYGVAPITIAAGQYVNACGAL